MIQASDTFKELIKKDIREMKTRVTLHYENDVVLTNEDVQNIQLCNSVQNILGGVQNDDVSITIMPDTLTDTQFNKDIFVTVEIGVVKADKTIEYIKVGKYLADGWKLNDSNKVITIQCSSYIDEDIECKKNIISTGNIAEYMADVITDNYEEDTDISATLVTHNVEKSWLCKAKLKQQLDTMAQGGQCIVRYVNGFEIVPFTHEGQTSCLTLKQGKNEVIFSSTRLTDYSKNKQNIKLLRTVFRETDNTQIASASVQSVNGVEELAVIKTSGPCNTTYVQCLNYYGNVSDVIDGIESITVDIYSIYSEGTYSLPFAIYGTKVEQIQKDKKIDATATYLTNPYMQQSLDKYDVETLTGVKYKIPYRGNPCIQCGDILTIDGVGDIKVTKHTLTFNGGLNGIIEGVLKNE